MTDTPRRRGRPATRLETIQKQKADAEFLSLSRPEFAYRADSGSLKELREWIAASEGIDRAILSEWRNIDATLPHALIYSLESLSEEWLTRPQLDVVIRAYEAKKAERARSRDEGQRAYAQQQAGISERLLASAEVQHLIDRVRTDEPRFSVASASQWILNQWARLMPGTEKPSDRTVRRILSKGI